MRGSSRSTSKKFRPTVLVLRNFFKYCTYSGLFPTRVHENYQPGAKVIIEISRSKLFHYVGIFYVTFSMTLTVFQLALYVRNVFNSGRKRTMMLGTSSLIYAAIFSLIILLKITLNHNRICKLLNWWTELEVDIMGNSALSERFFKKFNSCHNYSYFCSSMHNLSRSPGARKNQQGAR